MKEKGLISQGLLAIPDNLYNNGQGLRPLKNAEHSNAAHSDDEDENSKPDDEDSSSLPPTQASSPTSTGFLNSTDSDHNGHNPPPPSSQFGSDDQSLKSLMRILAEQQQIKKKEQKKRQAPNITGNLVSPTGNRRLTFQNAPPTPTPPMMSPTSMTYNPFFAMRVGNTPSTPTAGGVLQQLAAQHRVFNSPASQPMMYNQSVPTPPPPQQPQMRMGNMTPQNQYLLQNSQNYYMSNIVVEIQNATPPNFDPFERQEKQIKQMQRQLKLRHLQQLQEQIQMHMQLQGEVDDQEQPQVQQPVLEEEEQEEDQTPKYEPWLTYLHDDALQRYTQNAHFMNEVFFREISKEEPIPQEPSNEPNAVIQTLEKIIAHIDQDITNEEKKQQEIRQFEEQSNLFRQYYDQLEKSKTLDEAERSKRKLIEILNVQESEKQPSAKRTKRSSDENLFPIQ
jgi:hypothetical protein